jgi:DNA-binding transcriptional LysR family regulator
LTGRIERIKIFVKVAELNGFAAAARELGVTRSIATRYANELEDELGAQLLVRTTRKVSTTVAGGGSIWSECKRFWPTWTGRMT